MIRSASGEAEFGRLQPGSPGPVPLDIAARFLGRHLWQPGPTGPERRQFPARRLKPAAPVPSGLHGLPQVGMRLAPRPRLDNHAEFTVPGGALANGGSLHWLVTVGVVIQLAHTESMRLK